MDWNTACPDWEQRLIAGESIVPCGPLFPERAAEALRIFKSLRVVDVARSPTMGELARPWIIDYASAIFGAYDQDSGRQLIRYSMLLVSKKNGKALALDTEVATPTGFAIIADIQVGDYVLDIEHNQTRVTDKSPIFLQHACYIVTFLTGESVVCDSEHLWVTEARTEYLKPREKTTKEIYNTLKVGSGAETISNHKIRSKNGSRFISSVEPVESVPVQCISVESKSKQFLITRSLIPTHNSTLAAAMMLTALCLNWRKSAEFIILAPTVEVANNSFGPAKDMIQADDKLDALMHVQPHFRMITHRLTGATLKVIAADNEAVSGKKASGVLIDELWLLGKRANADSMLREAIGGLASRPEGWVIYTSTQSDQPPAGVFAERLTEFRDIRDGKVEDKRSLPILFEFPQRMLKNGDYRKPENFYITNPNLGASVDTEFLLDEWTKAERKGEANFRAFAAKHLNVEIGIALRSDGWAGAEYWPRGIDTSITFDSILERSECVSIGIDGGGLDDLLGVSIIGREKLTKRWLVWTHAFISPEGMERRKLNETLYKGFIADGDLTLVDQLPDDLAGVTEIVLRVKESGLLSCVGVDAIGIGGIVDAMDSIDVTEEAGLLRSVRQGISLMGAIKTVERKLADGSLLHQGQRMMDWCVGNVKVIFTPTAMRLARDESGAGKIDPLAAIFDAAELMMANPGIKSKERQLLFFGSGQKKKELRPIA